MNMPPAPLAMILSIVHVDPATNTRHRLALAGRLLRDALGVLFQSHYHATRDLAVHYATTDAGGAA
ncbi:hypothetical protein [Lamprocystis purpurea]|jgi:hypothetical protein|uniref:hypothetical protein n=1 Tax=Lamprocystis purpurea TaxID=61598 RepID=UPI00037DA7DE|nr:hypothetical protein [Lamprocystis purpurea]